MNCNEHGQGSDVQGGEGEVVQKGRSDSAPTGRLGGGRKQENELRTRRVLLRGTTQNGHANAA